MSPFMYVALMDAQTLFLREVSRAFRPGPHQLIVFGLAVGVPLLLLIAYSAVRALRQRRIDRTESEARLERGITRMELPPHLQALMYRLAATVPDPRKRHHVIEYKSVFNRALAETRSLEPIPDETVSLLRLRLGFTTQGGAPLTSAGLPPGAEVLLVPTSNPHAVAAQVTTPDAGALRLRLHTDERDLRPATPLRVLYRTANGVFGFRTTILNREGKELAVAHSSRVQRSQRRHYFRKQARIPIQVGRRTHSAWRRTMTRDLGGGGLSFQNPFVSVEPGELLVVNLENLPGDNRPGLSPTALVVVLRISDNGTVLHAAFRRIDEALRDRIYQALFMGDSGQSTGAPHQATR